MTAMATCAGTNPRLMRRRLQEGSVLFLPQQWKDGEFTDGFLPPVSESAEIPLNLDLISLD